MIAAVLVGLPLLAAAVSALAPRRWQTSGSFAAIVMLAAAALLAAVALAEGRGGPTIPGGVAPPLGIGFTVDGPGVIMVLLASVVMAAVTAFVAAGGATLPRAAWPLLHLLWAGLNTTFLTADLFNAYVALEVVSLAGIALIAVSAKAEALEAQLRYLFTATFGALAYLLGVALIYAVIGRLDVFAVAQAPADAPAVQVGAALVTVGLLVKMAAWPFHVWLPPAHAGAIAPVSALLSGLVVKAPAFLLLRFWTGPFLPLAEPMFATLLGGLGAVAIVWGSLEALRERSMKRLIAYSTAAQLGYLLIVIPLATAGSEAAAGLAWQGGILHALSHGLAKAGLFLAAGSLLVTAGHDRLRDLLGVARAAPLLALTIGVGGVSLMGLPPSLGFLAKWRLLEASFASGQWWWTVPILGGGLLAAAYGFRLLAFTFPTTSRSRRQRLRRNRVAALDRIAWALVCLPLALLVAAAPLTALVGVVPGYGVTVP